MLWLALYLPWLSLEALPPAAPGIARCVVEQRRVVAASRAAREAGVEVGLSGSTAASLAPQVRQVPRDAAREAGFVHLLALASSRYTPKVVLQPDGVLLEVAASLRLFGGLRSLLRQVRETARDCGAHPRIAVAPTAAAAALLARVAPARALRLARTQRLLDALPLGPALDALQQPLQPPPLARTPSGRARTQPGVARRCALAELLQTIGCRRLGELRALPRAGVHKRGGGALLDALDRAYGDAPDVQPWFEPPERFALALELEHRVDDAAALVFAFHRLVQALAGWLQRQWLAASRLTLKLRHERGRRSTGAEPPRARRRPLGGQARSAVGAVDSPDGELRIELGAASRDAAQIMALLRERLERHTLAAPVYAVELQLDDAVSHAGQAGRLLPDPGQRAQAFQALLDRLVSRLGAERVRRVALADDHRPERAGVAPGVFESLPPAAAYRDHPPGGSAPAWERPGAGAGGSPPAAAYRDHPPGGSAPAWERPGAGAGSPSPAAGEQGRPVWLLPEPLRLAERNGLPVHGSPLVLHSRAERIEAGWFDGALVCRDYHVAEGADHRLRWIYCERGSRGEVAWYLHGLFG